MEIDNPRNLLKRCRDDFEDATHIRAKKTRLFDASGCNLSVPAYAPPLPTRDPSPSSSASTPTFINDGSALSTPSATTEQDCMDLDMDMDPFDAAAAAARTEEVGLIQRCETPAVPQPQQTRSGSGGGGGAGGSMIISALNQARRSEEWEQELRQRYPWLFGIGSRQVSLLLLGYKY